MYSIDAVKALWEAASKIDPDLSKYWIFTSIKLNKF
jgi:hypothetical protein